MTVDSTISKVMLRISSLSMAWSEFSSMGRRKKSFRNGSDSCMDTFSSWFAMPVLCVLCLCSLFRLVRLFRIFCAYEHGHECVLFHWPVENIKYAVTHLNNKHLSTVVMTTRRLFRYTLKCSLRRLLIFKHFTVAMVRIEYTYFIEPSKYDVFWSVFSFASCFCFKSFFSVLLVFVPLSLTLSAFLSVPFGMIVCFLKH